MDRARGRGAATVFAVAALAYVADRVTKSWAETRLADAPIDVIEGVLTFRLTTNSGGAFSIGGSSPWIFVTASVVVIAVIVATSFRHESTASALAVGLILGGALGNLTDRAIRGDGFAGRVVDFIDLHVWPVFNLADTAIVMGAVLLAVASLRADRRAEPEPADAR